MTPAVGSRFPGAQPLPCRNQDDDRTSVEDPHVTRTRDLVGSLTDEATLARLDGSLKTVVSEHTAKAEEVLGCVTMPCGLRISLTSPSTWVWRGSSVTAWWRSALSGRGAMISPPPRLCHAVHRVPPSIVQNVTR